jgi:hypothetical protein
VCIQVSVHFHRCDPSRGGGGGEGGKGGMVKLAAGRLGLVLPGVFGLLGSGDDGLSWGMARHC